MAQKFKIVSVDTCTVSYGDIDFAPVAALGDVAFYDILAPGELAEAASDADALLVNKAGVTRGLLERCPRLKYVGTYSTGYNNLDIPALESRGITACNVPGYSTAAVCQHVFSLMLMFAGNTHRYAASVEAGDWIASKAFCYFPWRMREISGKVMGIYGYGNIGRAVARAAEAFGMEVIVHTRTRPDDCPYELVGRDEIFARSDFLSLHCPLCAETERLVNERTLLLMKKSAVLINTARGALIDEGALSRALNGGAVAGACLDVLAEEPMREDCPLFGAKNCIVTPHVAWGPVETRRRLVDIAARNLEAFLAGRPQNVITK